MYFTVFTWKGGPPASKEMNVVADLLLKKAFSDYEVVSGWKGTDIHVVNLRLNPDADVFSFLRNQPVQIVAGTAASVTISGLSAVGLVKDLWNAYRNNQVDLKLRLHVSDLKVTIRPSMDSTFVPNRRMLAEAIAKKMREVDRAISALATTAKVQWAVDDDDEESTTSRILEAAIQNLRVTIDRLHFRYEDDTTDSSQPLVLGVVVDSLQFFPCAGVCCCGVTASGAGAASSAEPARFRHHFVTWDGLAVYLNPGVSADVDVAPTIVAMATPTLPTASPAAPAPVRTHWTGLDMSRVQVLVAPSSGRVCLTQHGGRVTHSSCPAGTQVSVHVNRLQLGVKEVQLKLLRTLSSHFVRSKLLARYKDIPRPSSRTGKSLWAFAIACIRQDLSAAETMLSSASNLAAKAAMRRKYIIAYKWSLYSKRSRIVLPPIYYPTFSILQVNRASESTVLSSAPGVSAPASVAVVDWFNFSPSLPVLSTEVDTLLAGRAEANRIMEAATAECSVKELVDLQGEALAELIVEKYLQLRRKQQADMLAQEQKRTGGMFRKLKSETSALVAVPSSFARQFPGGLRLPASPLPDPVDAAAAGSKSLATGEWISALLSREAFTDSRNKDLQSIVQHVLNTDPTAVCFREGCKLTEEERTAIRGVLRTDTLHPPNYIGFSLTLHCEDVSVSLLTTNRHTVSELRLEGVHMRYAKLVSKAIELFGRLGKLDVIDRSQPSAAVSPTMWNELRHILSFTPSALDATSLSPDSTHVLQDLSLSSGFTSWRAVHPSLEYCRYMDLPALHAILRDDALCQLIVCGENITVASSAHTPLPQQTALGELIRFWKAAEQFSMLGSAYRSKTVVQGIFSTYFGVGTGGDGDAFVPTTAVRSALSGSDDRVLNELDVNITAILEGGADVPFSLFSGVQSAVECHLAVGPMLSFIQKHWCSLHGCFSAQCVSMGCSCPSALQAGGVQPVAPDPLSTVILFHVRHREAKPVYKTEQEGNSDSDGDDGLSSHGISHSSHSRQHSEELHRKSGYLLFQTNKDTKEWRNYYCVLNSAHDRLEWFSDATQKVLVGRASLSQAALVKFGDSELAGESLDEEGVAVFRLRGLSLLAAPSAHAHLSHSSSTSSVPSRTGRLGGKFWPFQSSAKDGTPQSPHCLLHVIAPSKGDAAEWKAALEVHMTTRSVASLSVHHKRKPHRPSRPAAVPDNIRTVLVLRVSPFRVILSDLLMTRIVRMLKRTAATFNADAVSGAYMDRVKMVAISRRFGFITPSVSSGSVSASVGAGDSIAPMASFGDVNTSSAKEGRVFIDAAASQVKLVIPLLERGSREVDPALATTDDPPPPPPPIFITAADSLAWAYDRRTGPVFRSNVMPVRLTHSANGEWEYLDSTSTEITEAMLLRVELSGCAVATFLPESSDAPRSLVADTDDDPESRAAKYSDWLACSHAYDAIRASINAVDVHFCQVAVSPPLPAVEASWMLSDSLPVIWKAAILRLVDPQLAVWRTTSPDHQRFPRAMVEVGVPSVRIIVSPEYVAPLTSLASVWAASLASTADKTSEPSAAVRQLPRVMLARESSNASLPERSARRANTFLRLRATTTVHVRIRADVPSVEVVLIGPRCADGPPSRSELFILRLQGLGLRYSHTVKAYEAKLDLSQLVVEYSGSAVGTDPGTTSSLLCIGIPTVDHTGDGTDPTPTPSQPSIGALSLAVRQSGNTHLAYLGSANLCVDCRLGLISIALPFLAVEDVKMCVDELLTSAAAARALAARVSPKGVSVSVPVPSSESFTPGTLPVAASTPITTPSTHGPTAGEKDDGLRTQSFVGWEKLFQKLEGAVGGFAELPALVTTLRTAHGSTAAPDADQQRVRPACALLHAVIDCEGVEAQLYDGPSILMHNCIGFSRGVLIQEEETVTLPAISEDSEVSSANQVLQRQQVFVALSSCTVSFLRGVSGKGMTIVTSGTLDEHPSLGMMSPFISTTDDRFWAGSQGCVAKLDLENTSVFVNNGSGVSFVREVVLASAGMAVRIEQDPKMLPPDVQEREYKEFTAGAKANTVRELLRMEALGRPLSVRIVTWNDVFQSLKGFEKTVYVMLGGVVAEVDPLCIFGLSGVIQSLKQSMSTAKDTAISHWVSLRPPSAPSTVPTPLSSPTVGGDVEEGREAKTSLTDTTIHVSEAIVRFYCLTSATWSVSEEKSFLEPVSGARHRRAAHGSLDGSQLNLVPFEPTVPKQSSLPAVVEHCEICMSECDVEIRDQADELVAEGVPDARHIRIAAVDVRVTDLSPPDATRVGGRSAVNLDASAFLMAKPNCFIVCPMSPVSVLGRRRRFRRDHSRTYRLLEAVPATWAVGARPYIVPLPSDGVEEEEEEEEEEVVHPGIEIRSGGEPAAAPPTRHCFVLSIVLPEDPGPDDTAKATRKARDAHYAAQQLQAWREGSGIPMPYRDASPLDVTHGLRLGIHATRLCVVHSKRFEDEIKAVIDVLRAAPKVSDKGAWTAGFILREKKNEFDFIKVNCDSIKLILPPTLMESTNVLVVLASSVKVANSPGPQARSGSHAHSDTSSRPVIMEYFTVVCEGVVASLLPSSGSPPVQLLGGSPGHTLRIHFGQPLNLMEKCAARVQMQTEVQLSGGASLSVAESLIDALQATLKTNTKEFSPLMRLPPVLVSESDMVIKAVVPSIQLRVEEVIDLAVPLVLKPKKPFVFAKHSAGQEPAPPAPLTTLSTSMVTPLPSMARKESRKVLEQKFSFSGGTAAGMGLSTRDMGVGTSDVIIPPPVPVPSRLTPVAPLLGSIPEGKSALSSSTLGSIPEGKSTPIRGPSPGRLLLRTGDSNGGAAKAADGEAKSSNSARKTARSANTCDLMVPDRKLKPVMETLSGGTPASTPPTFQDVMALVESRLRGMAAGAVTDPAAAVESMQRSCAVLADAVALTARRAINLSSQSREENVLLNKNIGLLVQLLAESQAAEMESTLARIHGPKP